MDIALAVIANAFGRRFAGGLLAQWAKHKLGGTHVARLIQATIIGATVAALGPVWWWGVAAIPLAFAGATAGFYGPHGMLPKTPWDFGTMAHGFVAVAPLAIGATLAGLPVGWLLAAGLLRAPCYWVAQKWQPHIPILGMNPDGIPDPPPFAEFLVGGLLGLAIALTL